MGKHDALAEQLKRQPAQLTQEQMEGIEAAIHKAANDDGIVRRCGLATLARSGADLIQSITADREAAVALAEVERCTRSYASRLRNLADMMDSAATRLLIAGCYREDAEAIRREAV